ncbi:MAG TPA: NADH-quinone oxidoreductase subunit C [Nitrososphaerales archaeon]|nr:NADH-quinone oxidoreductase subunit C [Nitrososphaerales archaeon]
MSAQQPKIDLPREEQAIVDSLSEFGDKVKVAFAKPNRIKLNVERDNLVSIARFLRNDRHFDHVTNVTGTDFAKEKQLEITYHLASIDGEGLRRIIIALSCRVPSSDARLPSLIEVFPSVEFHERETAEMLGVVFAGHPNLTRLLLPEDWNDIPPMLKAYRLPGRLEGE